MSVSPTQTLKKGVKTFWIQSVADRFESKAFCISYKWSFPKLTCKTFGLGPIFQVSKLHET